MFVPRPTQPRVKLAGAALLLGSLLSGAAIANQGPLAAQAASVSHNAVGAPPAPSKTKHKKYKYNPSQPKKCRGRGRHLGEKRCPTDVEGGQDNFWNVNDDGSIEYDRPPTQRFGNGLFLPVIFTPSARNVLAYYDDKNNCFTIVSDPSSKFGPVAVDVTADQYYLLPKSLPKNSPFTYCKVTDLIRPFIIVALADPGSALAVTLSRAKFSIGAATTIAPKTQKAIVIGGAPANSAVAVAETLAVPDSTRPAPNKSDSLVVYSRLTVLKADRFGVVRDTLRTTYTPAKASWAMLTVTIAASTGTFTRGVPVNLQPAHKAAH
jgi:hypothetical protein